MSTTSCSIDHNIKPKHPHYKMLINPLRDDCKKKNKSNEALLLKAIHIKMCLPKARREKACKLECFCSNKIKILLPKGNIEKAPKLECFS